MRITHSELLKILDYDPLTGIFRRKSGEIAGSLHSKGYVRVCIGRKEYLAHRLAWFYVTGEWPKNQIDHRNTVKSDNRFSNLRIATGSENGQNRNRMKNNTSGHKGVSWHKRFNKWQACIVTDGKFKYLGRFDTKEKAAEAYTVAALKYHGEFARLDTQLKKEFKMDEFIIMPVPRSKFTAVCALLGGGFAALASGPAKTVAPVEISGNDAPSPIADLSPMPSTAPAASPSEGAEVDAAGTPFDPARHTGTKVKSGLWRMKTGLARGPGEGEDAIPSGTGTAAGTPSTTVAGAAPVSVASATTPAPVDEDDEFAAFMTAAATTAPAARTWSDGDLSKLCNQAATKIGAERVAEVKGQIEKFVGEGVIAHSRNIPVDKREEFAKAVEAAFGITYEG